MNVHEYQAKELLRGYGVPLAQGAPAFTVEEAVAAAAEAARPGVGGEGADPRRRARQGQVQGARRRRQGRRAARQVDRRGGGQRPADAGQDAGDGPDRPRGPRRQAPLHRGGLRHRPRALSLGAGRPRHLAHLLHRLHRRRHGHREGGARDARQDRDAVDRPGVGLLRLPRPQDRLGAEAGRCPDRPVRDARRPALQAPSSTRT